MPKMPQNTFTTLGQKHILERKPEVFGLQNIVLSTNSMKTSCTRIDRLTMLLLLLIVLLLLLQQGKLTEALEILLSLEKQTRTVSNMFCLIAGQFIPW